MIATMFRKSGLRQISAGYHRIRGRAIPKVETQPLVVTNALKVPRRRTDSPYWVISSFRLHEFFAMVMAVEDGWLYAASGPVIGNIHCLERITKLDLEWQTELGAIGFQTNGLVKLHEFGMRPLALFSRSPGTGFWAAQPKEADREALSAVEQGTGEMLGACFTADRYVSFFTTTGKPKVRIIGKKVKEITKTMFRLEVGGRDWNR